MTKRKCGARSEPTKHGAVHVCTRSRNHYGYHRSVWGIWFHVPTNELLVQWELDRKELAHAN